MKIGVLHTYQLAGLDCTEPYGIAVPVQDNGCIINYKPHLIGYVIGIAGKQKTVSGIDLGDPVCCNVDGGIICTYNDPICP